MAGKGTERREGWAGGTGARIARGAEISQLLVGAHTRTQMVRAAVPVPRPTRGIFSWSAEGLLWPPQAAAQRDECISLPTGLCPAPLHHLKGAAEVGEGKQEVPPSDPASIETSRYIFTYFFPGC